jgi:hypothetical protein
MANVMMRIAINESRGFLTAVAGGGMLLVVVRITSVLVGGLTSG